jgi:hypothetical protein
LKEEPDKNTDLNEFDARKPLLVSILTNKSRSDSRTWFRIRDFHTLAAGLKAMYSNCIPWLNGLFIFSGDDRGFVKEKV